MSSQADPKKLFTFNSDRIEQIALDGKGILEVKFTQPREAAQFETQMGQSSALNHILISRDADDRGGAVVRIESRNAVPLTPERVKELFGIDLSSQRGTASPAR